MGGYKFLLVYLHDYRNKKFPQKKSPKSDFQNENSFNAQEKNTPKLSYLLCHNIIFVSVTYFTENGYVAESIILIKKKKWEICSGKIFFKLL